jgi:hypothetical protein
MECTAYLGSVFCHCRMLLDLCSTLGRVFVTQVCLAVAEPHAMTLVVVPVALVSFVETCTVAAVHGSHQFLFIRPVTGTITVPGRRPRANSDRSLLLYARVSFLVRLLSFQRPGFARVKGVKGLSRTHSPPILLLAKRSSKRRSNVGGR